MDVTKTPLGPPTHPADRLLDLLRDEERVLASSRDALLDLRAALRRGKLDAVKELLQHHAGLSAMAAKVADERAATAYELGLLHGLSKSECTLRALADHVAEPWAGLFRHSRDRLTALANEIRAAQHGNAILLETLRSFFRDVLTGLAPEAVTPVRYGPSGARLGPVLAAGFAASG